MKGAQRWDFQKDSYGAAPCRCAATIPPISSRSERTNTTTSRLRKAISIRSPRAKSITSHSRLRRHRRDGEALRLHLRRQGQRGQRNTRALPPARNHSIGIRMSSLPTARIFPDRSEIPRVDIPIQRSKKGLSADFCRKTFLPA